MCVYHPVLCAATPEDHASSHVQADNRSGHSSLSLAPQTPRYSQNSQQSQPNSYTKQYSIIEY